MSAASIQVILTDAALRYDDIRKLVDTDMLAVDRCIRRYLKSDVVLINQVAEYIIGSGGKRLRPIIHLLSAAACGYQGEHHIRLAAIIEFIHTATLLHDDVVDESELRRGRETVNAVWGNAASVLVGDFLYSRAFQMMVDADSMRIMDILAETTNTIAEGEVMQLMNLGDPDAGEEDYLNVIRCKTARLFAAACQLGAVLQGSDPTIETALEQYGMHLGTAFQLTDDLLDYTGDATELGKNVGDDLAEGKPTLPLIRVMRVGSAAQRELIRGVIKNGGIERLGEVFDAIKSTDALPYTEQRAITASEQAIDVLDPLPDSASKQAMGDLARYAIRRKT